MSKLKVAILEDNKDLLKDLNQNLEATGLVEVIVWAAESGEFLRKVKLDYPEALILDIDLAGDSMSGLDIAQKLQLPVLFVSGKTRDFLVNIEELNLNSENIVDHVSKPISSEKLSKILPKFVNQIRLKQNSQFAYLDLNESTRNKILTSDIVFLKSDKEHGSISNNKRIYFNNKRPETLVDFSFVKMEEKGLKPTQFVMCHKSFRVNADHIVRYDKNHYVVVMAVDSDGKTKEFLLPVSENYRKNFKRS